MKETRIKTKKETKKKLIKKQKIDYKRCILS